MPTLNAPSPGAGITYRWTADYQDSNGPDGNFITATVMTDWSGDILRRFPAGMLGTSESVGGNSIKRNLPHAHPDKNWLYCTHCELAGGIGYVTEETGNSSIAFDTPSTHDTEKANWKVQWSYLGYDLATDAEKGQIGGNGKELSRYVSRKAQPSVEALAIPGTTWKYSDTNAVIPEPTTIILAMKELEYTWMWAPFPYKESTWDAMLGKVNSATFDGRGRGDSGTSYPSYSADTVYFANYEHGDPVTDPEGNVCTHITFKFLVRRQGWNKFYRPGDSSFVAVVANDGSGRTPFDTADLMTIFD